MLECNESNISFQQHLCKLGKLSNSQVFGQNLWLQHFRTFCELVEGEENKLTTFSTWTILMLGCKSRAGGERHARFYHVTVQRMTKNFVRRCQSIYVYNLWCTVCVCVNL